MLILEDIYCVYWLTIMSVLSYVIRQYNILYQVWFTLLLSYQPLSSPYLSKMWGEGVAQSILLCWVLYGAVQPHSKFFEYPFSYLLSFRKTLFCIHRNRPFPGQGYYSDWKHILLYLFIYFFWSFLLELWKCPWFCWFKHMIDLLWFLYCVSHFVEGLCVRIFTLWTSNTKGWTGWMFRTTFLFPFGPE